MISTKTGSAALAPCSCVAEALRLVEADVDADHQIGREADEPGIAAVVRGAGLAGDRLADRARAHAGAALDHALQQVDHLIGARRRDHLLALVDQDRRAAAPARRRRCSPGRAASSRRTTVAPWRSWMRSISAGSIRLPPLTRRRVGAGQAAAGRPRPRPSAEARLRPMPRSMPKRCDHLDHAVHARRLGEPHGHQVARLLDARGAACSAP